MKSLFAILYLSITISVLAQPSNDDPCGAVPLDINNGCAYTNATTAGATNSSVANPSCGGYNGEDVWFVILVPANGSVIIDSDQGSLDNMSMSVYSAPNCNGPFNEVDCDENSSGNGNMPMLNLSGLTPGSYLYIRMFDRYSAGVFGIGSDPLEQGTFSICAQSATGAVSTGGSNNTGSYDCGNTPPAGNTCETATPICTFDGYCGSTSGYTAEYWYSGGSGLGGPLNANGIFCGSIENNSFISFIAGGTDVQLEVEVSGGFSCDDGVQFMMFGTADGSPACQSNSIVSFGCDSPMDPGTNMFNGTGLIPGQEYYLMVDGFAGDVCDYQINAISGVLIEMTAGPDQTICLGESVDLSIYGAGTGTITWTGPFLNTNTGQSVTATPNAVGTYQYIVEAPTVSPLCTGQATDQDTVLVTVVDNTPISVSAGTCSNGETVLTASGGTNYTWVPDASVDPTSGNTTTASPTTSTTYTVTGTSANGCTSSATIVVDPCDIPCDTPTVVYPTNICEGSNVTPTVDLTGGTFSFNPSGAPATINPTTGEIANATDGVVYTIEYSYLNNCGDNVIIVSTITGAPDCALDICNNGATLDASGGDGNYTWSNETSVASTTPITNEQECIDCSTTSPNYFFGIYTGCSDNSCASTTTGYNQYATGANAPYPPNFPLQVEDGSGGVIIYNTLADIAMCANSCTPPVITINNPASLCEPSTYDLSNALSGAGGNTVTYHSNLADANADANPLGSSQVSASGSYHVRVEDPIDPTCFTVDQIDVTINPVFNTTENIDLCSKSDYTYADGTVSTNILADESHISNLSSVNGCDSIVTENITVIPSYELTENITLCAGSNYTYPDGTVSTNITADESHISNLTSVTLCDSNITTNITITLNSSSSSDIFICPGEDYTYIDGSTSTNIFANESNTSTLVGTSGCDSLVTENILLYPTYNTTENISVCPGTTHIFPDGSAQVINAATTYQSSFISVDGCDSIITTNVSLLPLDDASFDLTNYCEGITNNATNIITGGGTFAFNPVPGNGEVINTATGEITGGIAGTQYTIEYTTTGACANTSAQTVDVYTNPIPTITGVFNYCPGGNGTLDAGSGYQTYAWSTNETSQTINSTAATGITVTVEDNNGCTGTSQPVDVLQSNQIVNDLQEVICDGQGVMIFGNMETTPNVYSQTFVSASGCDSIVNVTLVVNPLPAPVISGPLSYCQGGNVTLDAGGPFISYDWTTTETTQTITTLAQTGITVTVEDANGCFGISAPVDIVELLPIVNDSTITICQGETASIFGNNESVAGVYTQVFTNAAGCDSTVNITLDVNSNPVIDGINIVDVSCMGLSDGSAEVASVSNGSGNYDYLWSTTPTQTTAQASGLPADIYLVIVTDQNTGCTSDSIVTIADGPVCCDLTVDTISTTPPTCGNADGSITVQANGGTGGYTYSINGTANPDQNFNGLNAGSYEIIVFDNAGICGDTVVVNLSNLNGPIISNSIATNLNCFGSDDGTITITATGGIGALDYSIDNGTSQNNATGIFTNLTSGIYDIIVTDQNGCQDADQIFIDAPAPITFTPMTTDLTCFGSNDGSVLFTNVIGGTAPYEYSFDAGNNFDNTTSINNSGQGYFELMIADANGCLSSIIQASINEPAQFLVSAATLNEFCLNDCNGSIQLSAQQGTPPFTYSWPGNIAGPNSNMAAGLCSGDYNNIEVTDANGCSANVSVTLIAPIPPQITDVQFTDSGCDPSNCEGSIDITATNAISYSIGSFQSGSSSFNELCAGTYPITVADSNGCQATWPAILIDDVDQPIANFFFDPAYGTTTDPLINFYNLSENEDSQEWSIYGNTYNYSTNAYEFSHVFPADSGTYQVCLTVSNDEGCTDIACAEIIIREEFTFFVPNAFTPDGDAYNQIFKPVISGIDIQNYELLIFDRWGELIFESHNKEVGWDGRFRGNFVQDGVYVWKIRVKMPYTDERKTFFGHVTVLR